MARDVNKPAALPKAFNDRDNERVPRRQRANQAAQRRSTVLL